MKIMALFVAAFCLLAVPVVGYAQDSVRLFSIGSSLDIGKEKTSVASVREAEISFGEEAFTRIDPHTFDIELFDGKNYQAARTNAEFRGIDDRSWWGKINEGRFEGDVILTFHKGYVAGLIYSPEAVYEIVPRGNRHVLIELDQSLFPECGGELQPTGEQKLSDISSRLGPAGDSGDRIDILVVYTTATKNFLGGDTQARTLSQAAIDASNGAYANSRVRQRVRMVHAEEWVYTETASASTDLSNLRTTLAIQNLRDSWKADLVAMIGEIAGACGVAYLMGGSPSGNPPFGFSVTARSCAVGNLTFAHEIGHNMGSQHNPENGSGATFSYGYGHYQNQVFRTVMSYVDPCPNGCARRPYFSNPGVLFNGFPTGVENARDNARSLNNTADAIANYRYSGSSITLTDPLGISVLPRGIRRTVHWSSDNVAGNVRIEFSRDGGRTWQTLAANTPNDGSEAVTVWGRATRQGRLRIVSIDNPIVTDSSTGNFPIK